MSAVSRRHVLYIPGFDPVPPRAYRERYRRESAAQGQISGFEIEMQKSRSEARFAWHVEARMEGKSCSSEIELLYWADIVQQGMAGGVLETYLRLFRTAWTYIGSGTLFDLMRLRKGPIIAALYPVGILLGQALLALALVAALIITAQAGVGRAGWSVHPLFVTVIAALIGGLLARAFLRWCARRDRLYAWYLMKDFAFSSSLNGAYPPEQETRMLEFRKRIEEVLTSEVDEVLVVGHSSGAYVAVSVLADLLRSRDALRGGPVLSLLTLGQVVPMVSFLPGATRLRADLELMSHGDIAWVDISSPMDGGAFALCDPVSVSGVAPEGKKWPLVLSAAFKQTMSTERLAALKWRWFELHFQYLNAFDNLPEQCDAYDYFRVTAGPMTLQDRFGARKPSVSRIERAVNRYQSVHQ